MGFDAGALLFKIQAVGKALFVSDMRDAKSSIEGVDQASQKAKGSANGLGKSTDDVADKARKTKAPLDDQAKATKNTGDESESASKKQDKQAASAERQREAAKTLATGLLGVGFAFSAIMGLSVAKFTEFDAQMSSTSAATMATAQEQRDLADAALDAGADTAYSATEAAAAQEELAKAGQSVADITGGSLAGSLALAAAGQLEVARSAEIMATVLTQFRLPAEKAGHVADVLAAGAGKAQGSVDDLALALSYVGPLAASMGWSLEETAGTIAYFSTQGIAGEKAGTALRGVLAALQSPSEAAKKVMQQYGVTVYDASGNMVSAATVAQQLKEKLSGLTEEERNAAMGRIFGNEALSAATLLYEGGADAVTTWTDNVNDAAYATEQAAMKQDNLAGDIEKLGGAFDTALIKTGSGANTVLREMVQSVTALVDAYGEAPPEVQGTVAVLGTAGGAMAASAGFAVIAAEKMMDLKKAFEDANKSFGRTALLGGAVGLALTVVVGVVAALAQQQADAKAQAAEYATTLEAGTNRVTQATRDMVKENLAAKQSFLWFTSSSVFDQATKLGLGLDTVTNAAMGNVDALKVLRDTMNWGQVGTEEFRSRLEASGLTLDEYYTAVMDVENGVKGTNSSIEEAIRVAEQKARADGQAKDAAKEHEAALAGLAGKARDTELDVQGLADAIRGFGSGQLDAREAARQFEEALDAASASIKENGTTLAINTEAGRSNEAALDAIAQRALTSAAAIATQTGSQEEATRAVQRGRDELITVLGQFGITGQAAQDYADKLGLIPGNIPTAVSLNTKQAQLDIDSYISRNTNKEIILRINNVPVGQGLGGSGGLVQADGGVVSYYADGAVEHHVAQIARAGSYRVWAEPETMGETYVPHAEAKRARSEQIMSETASLFGGQYIPRSQMGAAGPAEAPSISVPITVTGSPGMNVEQLASRVQARVIEVIERKLK